MIAKFLFLFLLPCYVFSATYNGGIVTVGSSALPTGASTAAKQPALGISGTPSVDVITVQGVSGMTPFHAIIDSGTTAVTNSGLSNIPAPGLSATSLSLPFSLSKDAITDCSGMITTGATSQSLISANSTDKSIEIYNVSSTEILCFNYGATAALTDYCIPALGYYSNTINNQAIAVIAQTTAHAYKCALRR